MIEGPSGLREGERIQTARISMSARHRDSTDLVEDPQALRDRAALGVGVDEEGCSSRPSDLIGQTDRHSGATWRTMWPPYGHQGSLAGTGMTTGSEPRGHVPVTQRLPEPLPEQGNVADPRIAVAIRPDLRRIAHREFRFSHGAGDAPDRSLEITGTEHDDTVDLQITQGPLPGVITRGHDTEHPHTRIGEPSDRVSGESGKGRTHDRGMSATRGRRTDEVDGIHAPSHDGDLRTGSREGGDEIGLAGQSGCGQHHRDAHGATSIPAPTGTRTRSIMPPRTAASTDCACSGATSMTTP